MICELRVVKEREREKNEEDKYNILYYNHNLSVREIAAHLNLLISNFSRLPVSNCMWHCITILQNKIAPRLRYRKVPFRDAVKL
jgi:hypothetical protein